MNGTKKLIVGIFVGGCLLLFGLGLFLIGDSNQLFTKSFNVYAEFEKITGIQNGTKVRVGGMDAGTVTNIDVPGRPEGKFRVHLRVVEKLHGLVREDSVVSIQTDGVLGNKYLQIDDGTSAAAKVRENARIPSKEPFDWGDLMEEINGVVHQVNGMMAGIKDQLAATLTEVQQVIGSVDHIVKDATPQVKEIMVSSNRISKNLSAILDGVEAGQGTVGGLFKDEKLYASVRRSVDQTEHAVDEIRAATTSAKKIVSQVEDSDIVPEVEKAVRNLQQITLQVKGAVDKFEAASGEGGVGENLQRTLADAREAMSDLSEDTEALKRNFLFRGFFKKRGFYDLGSLNITEYKSKNFAKGFKQQRVWLENAELFTKDAKGVEMLSAAGKAKLDETMAHILQLPRNGPLVIEGYGGEGTTAQRYLVSRRRAVRVQTYLIERFHLRPTYVGVMAMGTESGERQGVEIASFYK